jgi:hypothetical protein
MQDRSPPTLQIFLLRTAGPYIWVKSGHRIGRPLMSALPPKADIARRFAGPPFERVVEAADVRVAQKERDLFQSKVALL